MQQMRKQKAVMHSSRKRNKNVLFVSVTVLCILVGYIVYAVQLPEEQVFENIDQIVQQKDLLQYGGDGPQPSSVLTDNVINPIESSFERIMPAWRAPIEDFYAVAQKETHQLRLASLMGLIDVVNADLSELQNRFSTVVTSEQGWSDAQGLSLISKLGDEAYAFQSQPSTVGPLLNGSGRRQNDQVQWSVDYAGQTSRTVSISALTADAFVAQQVFYDGAYKGVILMKFDADGTLACVRKSIETDQAADIDEIVLSGWDAYTGSMEPVFSVSNGKVTFANEIFE